MRRARALPRACVLSCERVYTIEHNTIRFTDILYVYLYTYPALTSGPGVKYPVTPIRREEKNWSLNGV